MRNLIKYNIMGVRDKIRELLQDWKGTEPGEFMIQYIIEENIDIYVSLEEASEIWKKFKEGKL